MYLLFLLIHVVTDLREHRIYVVVLAAQAFAGIVLRICSGQGWFPPVPSFLPGLFCLTAGRMSGEKIGYGDGWMILVGGWYLPLWQMLTQLLWGSLSACLYAGVVWVLGKADPEKEIPFAPFFLIGYWGGILYG